MISKTLKYHRVQQALTQAGLAKKAHVSQRDISLVEQGKVDPRLSTLKSIAFALGLEVMLIPTQHVAMVNAIINPSDESQPKTPLDRFGISDDEEEGA